jgi:hypothetical protein
MRSCYSTLGTRRSRGDLDSGFAGDDLGFELQHALGGGGMSGVQETDPVDERISRSFGEECDAVFAGPSFHLNTMAKRSCARQSLGRLTRLSETGSQCPVTTDRALPC